MIYHSRTMYTSQRNHAKGEKEKKRKKEKREEDDERKGKES